MPDMRSGVGRPRGNSGSPRDHSRSRSRTPSYSDSFESDDDKPQARKPVKRESSPNPSSMTGGGKRHPNKKGASQKGGQGRVSPRMLDVVARRMLSAKRVKVNDLRNEVDSLNRQIEELRRENKTLLQQARRQEKALTRADGANSELPSLLERHNEELRMVKEQLRRAKERNEEAQRKNKELDANLTRVTRHLTKLKELTEDKNLKEREVLSRRVNQLEDDMEERDKKIQDLERYIENLQKNHRHELSIEVHRHKETQKRLSAIEGQLALTSSNLKEKEKILEIQNIYTQRVHRAPHRINNSTGSTPLHFRSHHKLKTAGSADIGLTPREKAKVYEDRRRADDHRKSLERQSKKLNEATSSMQNIAENENDKHQKGQESDEESFPPKDRLERCADILDTCINFSAGILKQNVCLMQVPNFPMDFFYQPDFDYQDISEGPIIYEVDEEQQEDDDRRRAEQEETRRQRELQEIEAAALEREQQLQREEEEERRTKEEEERIRKEEEVRRRKEEEERRRKEEEEEEERRRQFEELQQRDAEERRKKDALLAKLKALDSGDAAGDSNKQSKPKPDLVQHDDPESPTLPYAAPKHKVPDEEESLPELPTLDLATGLQNSGRQAKPPPAPARPPNGDTPARKSSISSATSSKKQYNFKDQVENMHAGRPAYDDAALPYNERKKRGSIMSTADDDPFARRGSKRNNSRDASPLNNARRPSQPQQQQPAVLPWEVEDASDGDRMLPRRPSQQGRSIYPQKAVSPIAVSDDIEELTL